MADDNSNTLMQLLNGSGFNVGGTLGGDNQDMTPEQIQKRLDNANDLANNPAGFMQTNSGIASNKASAGYGGIALGLLNALTGNMQRNAFGKNQDDERTAHSTQKPIECMLRPIRNNTAEGESVYDPFLGSGTTLMAAEQLDRICYGIELDPAYCDMIVQRWIKYRNKLGKDSKIMKNGQICEDFNEC